MFELSREIMGAVALGFFWIHVLLIAGAAWLDGRKLARLGRGRIRAGVVRSGGGPDHALASSTVEQIGRSSGDGVIHFSDAGHRSELFGGVIGLDDGGVIELEPATEIAIWPDPQRRAVAAARDAAELRASAAVEARRARGWPRSVSVTIGEGERVFVVEGDSEPAVVIIATIDPRRWLARKRGLIAGFVLAELVLASACTIAIVWPPMFGWLSMLGAAAALGLFLGVQPLGVAVRDAVRTPDRAYLRGRWG